MLIHRSTVTGLLLAGVGHVTEPPDSQRNFLVVDQKTETSTVANAFRSFTQERKDVGIVLINQHVGDAVNSLMLWSCLALEVTLPGE